MLEKLQTSIEEIFILIQTLYSEMQLNNEIRKELKIAYDANTAALKENKEARK